MNIRWYQGKVGELAPTLADLVDAPTLSAVDHSPISRLTSVTAISMMFIGSFSCFTQTATIDGGFSAVTEFGP